MGKGSVMARPRPPVLCGKVGSTSGSTTVVPMRLPLASIAATETPRRGRLKKKCDGRATAKA
jgi:hypothetical protein